jgi:hypothetical protein
MEHTDMKLNDSTTLKAAEKLAAAGPNEAPGGIDLLWLVYRQLGMDPESAMAAARADASSGLTEGHEPAMIG